MSERVVTATIHCCRKRSGTSSLLRKSSASSRVQARSPGDRGRMDGAVRNVTDTVRKRSSSRRPRRTTRLETSLPAGVRWAILPGSISRIVNCCARSSCNSRAILRRSASCTDTNSALSLRSSSLVLSNSGSACDAAGQQVALAGKKPLDPITFGHIADKQQLTLPRHPCGGNVCKCVFDRYLPSLGPNKDCPVLRHTSYRSEVLPWKIS